MGPSQLVEGLNTTKGEPPPSKGDSQVVLAVKNSPANEGDERDAGSIPGLGRSPGGGHFETHSSIHA